MNLPKLLAVLALSADALTWALFGHPLVAACWLFAAIATAIFIPAR